jgi:hypothetical protein
MFKSTTPVNIDELAANVLDRHNVTWDSTDLTPLKHIVTEIIGSADYIDSFVDFISDDNEIYKQSYLNIKNSYLADETFSQVYETKNYHIILRAVTDEKFISFATEIKNQNSNFKAIYNYLKSHAKTGIPTCITESVEVSNYVLDFDYFNRLYSLLLRMEQPFETTEHTGQYLSEHPDDPAYQAARLIHQNSMLSYRFFKARSVPVLNITDPVKFFNTTMDRNEFQLYTDSLDVWVTYCPDINIEEAICSPVYMLQYFKHPSFTKPKHFKQTTRAKLDEYRSNLMYAELHRLAVSIDEYQKMSRFLEIKANDGLKALWHIFRGYVDEELFNPYTRFKRYNL